MNQAEYFYKNGCTVCEEGKIQFNEYTFTYICDNCGAFASAHRKNSDYAKKYEPYQYLASPEINTLRKNLEKVFNTIWQDRLQYERNFDVKESAIINLIFNDNIRIYENKEQQYVRIIYHDKQNSICDVFSYDKQCLLEGVDYNKLKPVTNRQKTYVWLSNQLGIRPENCQIGYLTELQLKKAIEICMQSLNDARRNAIESYNQGTEGT